MVRLIRINNVKELFELFLFQSHYGSINTNSVLVVSSATNKFQSHYGSINT